MLLGRRSLGLLEFLLVLPLLLRGCYIIGLHIDILRLGANQVLFGSEADGSAWGLRFEVLLLLSVGFEGVSGRGGKGASFLMHLRNWSGNQIAGEVMLVLGVLSVLGGEGYILDSLLRVVGVMRIIDYRLVREDLVVGNRLLDILDSLGVGRARSRVGIMECGPGLGIIGSGLLRISDSSLISGLGSSSRLGLFMLLKDRERFKCIPT